MIEDTMKLVLPHGDMMASYLFRGRVKRNSRNTVG